MDPVTALLLALLAFGYATRDAWKGAARSYAADKRKGHNELAWWGRELLTGMPHAREPFLKTWRAHGSSTREMKNDRLKNRPGEITQKRTVKDSIAEHKRKIAEAKTTQPAAQAPGRPPGDQLPATQITQPTQPKPKTQTGHDPMACKDPSCSCHTGQGSNAGGGQPAAPSSTNGQTGGTMTTPSATQNGHGGSGDNTYDEAHQTIDAIKTEADQTVNQVTIQRAQTLADGLPAMIPTDSETVGHIANAVACLQQAKQKAAEAAEHAEAGKATLTKNHGQQHEAVQSTGHDSQLGFHNVG
jgi:hypothetical protein